MASWSFLTKHGRALLCVTRDPGVRLRDIAAALEITERSAYAIVNDLVAAGYVVKERDGRRNRYVVQRHLPLPETSLHERTIGEVLELLLVAKPQQPTLENPDGVASALMKAAVYYETGPPDVLRYEDVADPVCYDGGVILEVEAISIEGGDTLNRAGGEMPAVPHIVGYQCAGTIREVCAGVTDRHVGQRVVATNLWGSHAELTVVPAILTWPVPDGADMQAVACVPVAFGTADDCLFEFGHLQAGETVLIQAGAGGVGIAAIQLAEARGCDRHRHRVE